MSGSDKEEVLVVVSKLKNYIKSAAEMNTSGNVAPMLSEIIRKLCDKAVENAKKDGRKTVMDRDFSSLMDCSSDSSSCDATSTMTSSQPQM